MLAKAGGDGRRVSPRSKTPPPTSPGTWPSPTPGQQSPARHGPDYEELIETLADALAVLD
jgi:hypothetical protein